MFLIMLASASALRINPAHAKNITVYHVNPHKYGAKPINMDTGDATGDLFFDLFEVIIAPLACPHGAASGHGCTNPEAVSPDLMVNKLILEVDDRFSDYAKCNIGINGTDQRGHACKDDTYCCFCEAERHEDKPCEATLGREELYNSFGGGGRSNHSSFCRPWSKPSDCYRANSAQKLTAQNPGFWYSSLASGYCGNASSPCTWRVAAVEKIVTRQCHSKVFGAVVEATAPACFDGCGTQKTNTSSPCWVDCFYKAALGPDSGKHGGAVAGMPLDALVKAWEKPFLDESLGGCPAQTELPSWFQPPPQQRPLRVEF